MLRVWSLVILFPILMGRKNISYTGAKFISLKYENIKIKYISIVIPPIIKKLIL
jgi:hypothetical protein